MNNLIEVKNLSVVYDDKQILHDVSFKMSEADIICLLGPSGCGKTTLLRCIAGFEKHIKGEIWIKGVRASNPNHILPVEQRQIGMVFQDFALFPHLNVRDNITFGLKKLSPTRVKQRLDELIELLSLSEQVNKYPHKLSGGQQQRVALARAMAPRPDVLLLDEPFSSLDVELREQIAKEIHGILKEDEITTIMVSHNQLEAFAMADVVGVMNKGKLLQLDTPFNLYHEPESDEVANFIGEGVFIPGTIINRNEVSTEIGTIKGQIPESLKANMHVNVLIRPDDILHDDDSNMTALVKDKAFRGAEFLYTLVLESGLSLLSLVPSHHNHPVNEPIGIRLEIDHLVVFPENKT